MCARAARGDPLLLPWVSVTSGHRMVSAVPAVHNTAACRGRCAACRTLAQPPPSYSKLCEEEQPPEYNDSLVIKEEVEEAAPEYSDAIVLRMEEVEPADTNRDVIINMEDDEEEKKESLTQEKLSKKEDDKISLNPDSSLDSETDQINS